MHAHTHTHTNGAYTVTLHVQLALPAVSLAKQFAANWLLVLTLVINAAWYIQHRDVCLLPMKLQSVAADSEERAIV